MKRTPLLPSLLLAATLSGCIVAPPMRHASAPGIYLPAPGGAPGNIWIDGLWLHEGGRRTWQPGRWEHRPYGNAWEAPHRPYENGGEHRYKRGGWR